MTPYAIKMALLDVAIRTRGVSDGAALFPLLRDLRVAMAPPDDIVIFKTFGKIWRPVETKESKRQKATEALEDFEARMLAMQQKQQEQVVRGQHPYYSSIAFREYVRYQEPFELAFAAPDDRALPDELPVLLLGINYFGKRGGFVQVMEQPRQIAQPDARFIELTAGPFSLSRFHAESTLQMLDDCDSSLTFDRANVYNTAERVTLGKERILRHVVLPYRVVRWSRGYSWYQRIVEPIEEEE